MRPLRQSSRRSSVCAFLICSGVLAGNAAGASATGDGPLPKSAFCASWAMRSVATAPVGSVTIEIAIATDPARQTQPCIANLFFLVRLVEPAWARREGADHAVVVWRIKGAAGRSAAGWIVSSGKLARQHVEERLDARAVGEGIRGAPQRTRDKPLSVAESMK